ncbi:MAG: hypothetical protein MJY94_05260 [Bacteroidales bacterium]|nr:hypothetical protein [Bacteroidales bacterium]
MKRLHTVLIFALCPFFLWAQGDFNYITPTANGLCAIASSEGSVLVYTLEGSFHKEIHVSDKAVNAVAYFADMIFCGCDDGLMAAITKDDRVMELRLPKKEDVTCMTLFKDKLIAAGDKGVLVTINQDLSVLPASTKAKGRFVGIAAMPNECFALTDKGELLRSRDGASWTLFDFNTYYKGFYPVISFSTIQSSGSQLIAAGTKSDGSPAAFMSNTGGVWSERLLVYQASDGRQSMLDAAPLSCGYDAYRDRFVLGCKGGVIFTIPGCSHCNRLYPVADDDVLGIYLYGPDSFIVGRNSLITVDAVIE